MSAPGQYDIAGTTGGVTNHTTGPHSQQQRQTRARRRRVSPETEPVRSRDAAPAVTSEAWPSSDGTAEQQHMANTVHDNVTTTGNDSLDMATRLELLRRRKQQQLGGKKTLGVRQIAKALVNDIPPALRLDSISSSTIHHLFTGATTDPKISVVLALAAYFDVAPQEIEPKLAPPPATTATNHPIDQLTQQLSMVMRDPRIEYIVANLADVRQFDAPMIEIITALVQRALDRQSETGVSHLPRDAGSDA